MKRSPAFMIGSRLSARERARLPGKIVGAEDLRQLDRRRVAAREADHVERHHVAENVARVTEEIVRIEQRRDVPPQSIADFEQQRNERARMVGAIVFDVESRLQTRDGAFGTSDNLAFHALDVDLEQTQPWQVQAVEGDDLDLITVGTPERDTAEVLRPGVVE